MFTEEPEEPASVIVLTPSGAKFDINNISGATKARLIMEGEMNVDDFVLPSNMPGNKLAEIRAQHREGMEKAIKEQTDSMPNKYKLGDLVRFKDYVSEVLETDPVRGVKVRKREGGSSKWIHHTKVTSAESIDEA